MFSMYLQSGVPRYIIWRFIVVLHETSLFSCLCILIIVGPKLWRQHDEIWVFVAFSCCIHQKKIYPGGGGGGGGVLLVVVLGLSQIFTDNSLMMQLIVNWDRLYSGHSIQFSLLACCRDLHGNQGQKGDPNDL